MKFYLSTFCLASFLISAASFASEVKCEFSSRKDGQSMFEQRSSENVASKTDQLDYKVVLENYTLEANFENMHPAPGNNTFLDFKLKIKGPNLETYSVLKASDPTANLSVIVDGKQYTALCWL